MNTDLALTLDVTGLRPNQITAGTSDFGPYVVIHAEPNVTFHLRGSWEDLEAFARLLATRIADAAQSAAEAENEGRNGYEISPDYECERPADWDGFDDALDEEERHHRESADEWRQDELPDEETTMIQREHRVIYATRGAL